MVPSGIYNCERNTARMSDGDESRPSDTMRGRVPENSRKFWLLLNANRWLVAAGISGGVFLALATIGQLHPTGTPALFSQADPIETLFQGASERIAHTAALMRELDAATLAPRRRSLFAAAFEVRDPGGWLDADPLRDAAPVWRRRVVLDALEAALPTAPRTDAVARQVAALLDAQVGRRVPLGAGTVWRERGGLRLVPERAGTVPPTPLPFGETVDTAHGAICVERIDAPPADLSAGAPGTVYADADRLGRDLVVRSWTDGDRIQPLGMDGTKSVADLLTDAQVPPHRREHALVVAKPEHAKLGHAKLGHATCGHAASRPVAWVAGVRLDHRVRVRDETRHYAKLTLR